MLAMSRRDDDISPIFWTIGVNSIFRDGGVSIAEPWSILLFCVIEKSRHLNC